MSDLLEIFSVAWIVVTLVSLSAAAVMAYDGANGYETVIIESRYIRKIYDCLVRHAVGTEPIALPRNGRRRTRRILARLLGRLSDRVVVYDRREMMRIVCRTETDRYLTGAGIWPAGRAARYGMAARLPMPAAALERLRKAASKRNRAALEALAALAVNSPEDPIDVIGSCDRLIPIRNLLEIRELLIRKEVRLDYRKYVDSGNPNLVVIGLTLIGDFQILEAEQDVLNSLAAADGRVVDVAMHTLALLRSRLSDERIMLALSKMSRIRRLEQYRMFIREGYSLSALRSAITLEKAMESGLETTIADTVQTHKRALNRRPVLTIQ